MSAAGDRELPSGGRDSPVGPEETWARSVGAGDWVVRDSRAHESDLVSAEAAVGGEAAVGEEAAVGGEAAAGGEAAVGEEAAAGGAAGVCSAAGMAWAFGVSGELGLPGAFAVCGVPGIAGALGGFGVTGAPGGFADCGVAGGPGGLGVCVAAACGGSEAAGGSGGSDAAGAAGGLGDPAEGRVRSLEPSPGSWSSEDSDFGPAEEEQLPQGPEALVDAYRFPMAGFRFMFLDMVHSLLYRIYHNDHILIRTRGGRLMVRPRPHTPEASQPLPALQAPEPQAEGPKASEAQGLAGAAAVGPSALEPAEEPGVMASAPEETMKYQYENYAEEAQDAGIEEEKEKVKKQGGPEEDLDQEESKPGFQ